MILTTKRKPDEVYLDSYGGQIPLFYQNFNDLLSLPALVTVPIGWSDIESLTTLAALTTPATTDKMVVQTGATYKYATVAAVRGSSAALWTDIQDATEIAALTTAGTTDVFPVFDVSAQAYKTKPYIGGVFHVRDKKAYNADGGTFTSGADQTRDLNTSVTNTITGASLSSNQITLPAGTYEIDWTAPAYHVNQHWSWLYDTTGAATLILGGVQYAVSANGGANGSHGRGRFTLTTSSVLEIRHRCTSTFATQGYGVQTSVSGFDSVYTEAMIWKVS